VILLDTNICIAALKGDRRVLSHLVQHTGHIYLSMLVLAELQFGLEKLARMGCQASLIQQKRALLQQFIDTTDGVLELGRSVISIYADLRAQLELAGTPIGTHDLWIAAQAVDESATLVSANTHEFERVPGLKLQNWLA
jgi:tRNA(fMet)-specific endonuclease VapC